MAAGNLIIVEVAYALPDEQKIISLEVEKNSTIETVIDRSGILECYPEIDLMKQKVGIFGRVKKLTDKVVAHDRIEIYRGLITNPMEARRKRVNRKN